MYKSVLKRFLKGFLAGGLSSAIVVLNAGITISSIADLKQFAISLLLAFMTGGMLAIDKALRWR
jgi:hypothetical protein